MRGHEFLAHASAPRGLEALVPESGHAPMTYSPIFSLLYNARRTHYDQSCIYCGVDRPVSPSVVHDQNCPLAHQGDDLEAVRRLLVHFIWSSNDAHCAAGALGKPRANGLEMMGLISSLQYRVKTVEEVIERLAGPDTSEAEPVRTNEWWGSVLAEEMRRNQGHLKQRDEQKARADEVERELQEIRDLVQVPVGQTLADAVYTLRGAKARVFELQSEILRLKVMSPKPETYREWLGEVVREFAPDGMNAEPEWLDAFLKRVGPPPVPEVSGAEHEVAEAALRFVANAQEGERDLLYTTDVLRSLRKESPTRTCWMCEPIPTTAFTGHLRDLCREHSDVVRTLVPKLDEEDAFPVHYNGGIGFRAVKCELDPLRVLQSSSDWKNVTCPACLRLR